MIPPLKIIAKKLRNYLDTLKLSMSTVFVLLYIFLVVSNVWDDLVSYFLLLSCCCWFLGTIYKNLWLWVSLGLSRYMIAYIESFTILVIFFKDRTQISTTNLRQDDAIWTFLIKDLVNSIHDCECMIRIWEISHKIFVSRSG